ncbi:MAG: FtsX-like permease family protein [Candidatus Cloacimonadaceae bacterium]|nr:ABC transporter permease [Candidatus Cloacimonadota bacterium]
MVFKDAAMQKKNDSVWYLARKYLAARSRFGIGSAHLFTLLGISLGVMALITVSSVMNGFREDIGKRIIGTLSEMRLSGNDGSALSGYPQILDRIEAQGFEAAPVVRTELLLRNDRAAVPAICFGIDPTRQRDVSPVLHTALGEEGIIAGSIDAPSFNSSGIALGAGLAQALGVYLDDEIQLISPHFNIPTAFGLLPRVQKLQVVAIFAAGMPEYDQSYSYIPLSVAQSFNSYGDEIDYIEIRSGNPEHSNRHIKTLSKLLPDYRLEDWSSFDSSLYSAIRFEKYLMFVILLFMFIIASFNLTGSLLKLISQKKRELGLLKALGLEDRDLRKLFLYQGLMLCSLGIILGLMLASLLLIIQDRTGLVKLDDAIVLPVKLQVADFILVIIVSYIITILSVQLPLRKLKSINAVELIRRNI